MTKSPLPEYWLRGPVDGIAPLLQPVAHALLQARDEISELVKDFPEHLLWEKPAGLASPGFHLQHVCGVIDRLFTYADGRPLTLEQLAALKAEGVPAEGLTVEKLMSAFHQQVDKAIEKLKSTDEDSLTSVRGVGRSQFPSTVLGLLFHAAEHTMRHTGQLLVTVYVVKAKGKPAL
ncbi:DinB family protein [Flavisolibacter nicotianae]|uniref:DinB family protein n=1 Tax=Flavisolibacter nicotianae TaxID=2364882 RepID=UPI000EABF0F9|nr:DinB family protein [Flavisolibacter nicotianae]